MWSKLMRRWFRSGGPGRACAARRPFLPRLEPLGERIVPAITAFFSPAGGGVLRVVGDAADNTITVSRDALGALLVNGGTVVVRGGTPNVANTARISVSGLGGNDTIALDDANGALPQANLIGGGGNDTLTGGAGSDRLFGLAGNDTLLGKGSNDQLYGGVGDDTLTEGTGDDQAFGQAGNDLMIWNPGEGSDLNEGGAGIDTVEVNGGNVAETFTIAANGKRVRLDRVTPGPFFVDIGGSENLVLNANGGNDTVTAGDGLAGLISLTVNGGTENDTITGGDGDDILTGGDGDDRIIGGPGEDVIDAGPGNNTVIQ